MKRNQKRLCWVLLGSLAVKLAVIIVLRVKALIIAAPLVLVVLLFLLLKWTFVSLEDAKEKPKKGKGERNG